MNPEVESQHFTEHLFSSGKFRIFLLFSGLRRFIYLVRRGVGHQVIVTYNGYCYNNNNNSHDNVYGAVIMTKVIARVHPVHLMNAD